MQLLDYANKWRLVRQAAKKQANFVQIQRALLQSILQRSCANGGCDFARKHRIMMANDGVCTMEQFRARIPLCTYSDIAADVDKVAQTGCKSSLCSDPVIFLTATTGTTGPQRLVPVTKIDIDKSIKYLLPAQSVDVDLLSLKGSGVGGTGNVPSLLVGIEKLQQVMIRDWDNLIFDVEHGTLHREVPPPQLSHAPMPSHASVLSAYGSKVPPGMPGWVHTVFPRLKLVVANVPNPALRYVSELEKWFGDGIQFRPLMYGASECVMALPPPSSTFKENKFRLLADAAFFEFLPVDEEEAKRCAGTGGAILPQEGVVGHIYEMVLTNFSGLWRYRIGDAIQLVGFEGQCPEIKFAYRVGSVLSIFGENINEIHLRKIMATVFGSNVVDFTFFQDDTASRYHAYVELNSPLDTEAVSGLSDKMDQAIRQTVYNCRLYPIKKPFVMIVKPGTFAALTSHIQRTTLSQAKVPPRLTNPTHINLLNDNVTQQCLDSKTN
ncbi:indole-3-acetic acid-amido synthetase GH3.17 [Pelomyxa schiedti]|nr:indole-3-acetic acid-amido synthetase GH3.17 [Pelomyxa schiedti]KAH3760040.1 indole-3-acetic acid-amido synthetase GH3.17 [Pelomyxa schiedti]